MKHNRLHLITNVKYASVTNRPDAYEYYNAIVTRWFYRFMAAAMAAGDPQLALELHQRLEAAGLRPDGLTYTSLIQVGEGRVGGGVAVRLRWELRGCD